MAGEPFRSPPRRGRRDPLRRRTDRLRGRLGLGLLLAVLAAVPVAGPWAADRAHRHFSATAEDQARTRHRTTAVLVAAAPHAPAPRPVQAPVRYTGPDGGTRTARTAVEPGLPARSTVPVWVTADGRLTGPPLTGDEIRSRAAGWALVAALAVAGAGALAYGAGACCWSSGTWRPGSGNGPARPRGGR
ncbi:Rv1733c family protein [Streptomyces sp. JW3]|uniref:Rv1733c family protein n=1 Tax=Streptomyces sp. JW3 TaxID=3456955 RepID=UPI003FA479EA